MPTKGYDYFMVGQVYIINFPVHFVYTRRKNFTVITVKNDDPYSYYVVNQSKIRMSCFYGWFLRTGKIISRLHKARLHCGINGLCALNLIFKFHRFFVRRIRKHFLCQKVLFWRTSNFYKSVQPDNTHYKIGML